MTAFSFTVISEPMAQPRTKAVSFAGHARVYTPQGKVGGWKVAVREAALEAKGSGPGIGRDIPVAIHLDFRFRRPKGHFGVKGLRPSAPLWHVSKPDFDNLAKSTVDALVDCGLLADDKSIVEANVTKSYCLPNEEWGCDIELEVLL